MENASYNYIPNMKKTDLKRRPVFEYNIQMFVQNAKLAKDALFLFF